MEDTKLKKLVRDVITQNKGLKNNWCGMWSDCSECQKIFAYSWNCPLNVLLASGCVCGGI